MNADYSVAAIVTALLVVISLVAFVALLRFLALLYVCWGEGSICDTGTGRYVDTGTGTTERYDYALFDVKNRRAFLN